jgi:hypothetical protein
MNMAETYLLRGEKQKAADMLAAALNHSYTTKVWKEEILVDVDQPRACDTPHSKRANMEGTGDMPEAWANANLVLLLRDMLLSERDGKLALLPGLLESWVPEGTSVDLENAPVTTGGVVSLRVQHVKPKLWRITIDPHGVTRNLVVYLPVEASRLRKIKVNGIEETLSADARIPINGASMLTTIEVELQ